MEGVVRVGIADMKVCQAPDSIETVGLGSCVGVVIYDKTSTICGLVHIMLPDSTKIRRNENIHKFADTGVKSLVETLEGMGVKKINMLAKIAGGAAMFKFGSNLELGSIGDNNVASVKKVLDEYKIKIVAEEVGKNYGRTIVFNPETKELKVITAGRNIMLI